MFLVAFIFFSAVVLFSMGGMFYLFSKLNTEFDERKHISQMFFTVAMGGMATFCLVLLIVLKVLGYFS